MTGTRSSLVLSLVIAFGAALFLVLRLDGDRRTPAEDPAEVLVVSDEPEVAVETNGGYGVDLRPSSRTSESKTPRIAEPESTLDAARPLGITVRVVDAKDLSLVPGARIRIIEDAVVGEWISDERGECFLPIPEGGEFLEVIVEKEGYFHLSDRRLRSAEYPLLLERAAALCGRVLDEHSDAPLPGATVVFRHGDCDLCTPERIIADDRGSFEFPSIPREHEVIFDIAAEGYASRVQSFELRDEGARLQHDFRLSRGMALNGEVVDYTRGTPVPGVEVHVWIPGISRDRQAHHLITDKHGRFDGRIPLVAELERAMLMLQAEGYCTMRAPFPVERFERDGYLRLILPEGLTLEGRVTGSSGQPVEGAKVRLRPDAERQRRGDPIDSYPWVGLLENAQVFDGSRPWSQAVDVDGRYRVRGLLPGVRSRRLHAWAEGFQTTVLAVPPTGGPGTTHRLDPVLSPATKPPTGTIRGRITLNGEPGKAWVHWVGSKRRGGVDADENGEYEDTGIEPGEVVVEVWPEVNGWSTKLVKGARIEVTIDPDHPVEHDFDLEYRVAPIAGRVVFDDGRPAAGFEIDIGSADEEFGISWELRGDASFSIDLLDVGEPYTVSVWCLDEQYYRKALPGTTDVELVLPSLGLLLLRVRDAVTREAVPNFVVGWKHRGEQRYRLTDLNLWDPEDPDGWREVLLPLSELELIVRSGGLGYLPETVGDLQLTTDVEGTRLDVELAKGAEIAFVLAPGQEPLDEERVVVLLELELWEELRDVHDRDRILELLAGRFPGWSFRYRGLWFGEDGVATVRGLTPGVFRFKALRDDLEITPGEVVVAGEKGEPILLWWAEK